MTSRRGEITRSDLQRQWPASRGGPGGKGAAPQEQRGDICAAGVLSATLLTYSLRRDDSEFVVFCFSKPGHAKAFTERFGGRRLPVT
jgi:hypothetical protein